MGGPQDSERACASPRPLSGAARLLLITSPKRETYKDVAKVNALMLYMPLWSMEELLACRRRSSRSASSGAPARRVEGSSGAGGGLSVRLGLRSRHLYADAVLDETELEFEAEGGEFTGVPVDFTDGVAKLERGTEQMLKVPACSEVVLFEEAVHHAGAAYAVGGRVEILYNGTWGTVCRCEVLYAIGGREGVTASHCANGSNCSRAVGSDGFEVAEARVTCRQLGLPDVGALPFLNATFGAGTGPIWLTKLRCWGFEPTLANCNTPMTGINGCNHAMDAGVRCLVLSAAVDCVGSSGSSSTAAVVDVAIWRDSLLRDLPLNPRALLQCLNCTRLEAVNVTLTGVRGVGASLGSLHGPLHATGLRSAALERFNCSDVRGGNGWACVMLQYDTTEPDTDLRLDVTDSIFTGNSVSRGGLYGTHGSTRDTATTVGHGMIVAGGADPLSSHPDAFGTWLENSAMVVTLRGVAVRDNSGGMGTFFSSIDLPVGRLSVTNCSFTNNTSAGDGGVFWVWGPLSELDVGQGSRLDNNTAALSGGAVMVGATLDLLSLTGGSSISGNRAVQWQGGGVWANDQVGRVELRGGSAMDRNSAGWSGGALSNTVRGIGVVLLSDGSSMSYNVAKLRGGAVASDVDITNVTLESGSVMNGNSAGQNGGVVAAERGLKRLSLAGRSEMRGNVAAAGGGALGVPSGAVDAVVLEGGSSITGCSAAGGDGGAVWAARGLRELRVAGGSAIDGNAAPAGQGGALAITSGALGILGLADGAAAAGNAAAGGSGGGIWVSGTVNSLRITGGAALRANAAAVSGGGIWVGGNAWSLGIRNGSALSDNTAGNGTGAGLCVGGAIRTWVIDGGSELSGNAAAAASGGGAWIGGAVTNLAVASGGRLEHNVAAGDGAAIWVGGRLGNVSLADGAIAAGNSAGGDGGVLYAAVGLVAFAAGGGARLDGNFAGMNGGAVAAEEVPTLLRLDGGVAVANNTAKRGQGGAFSLRASGAAVNVTIAISGGASLLSNTAGLSGGALYLAAAESYDSVADTTTAAVKAGSIATATMASTAVTAATTTWTVLITDATLSHNAAGWAGGAVLASAASRAALLLRISNCTLMGNRAGDGTSSVDSAVSLHGCSFSRNAASQGNGGALSAATGGGVRLLGCMLRSNTAGASGGAVAAVLPTASSSMLSSSSASVLLGSPSVGSSGAGGAGANVTLAANRAGLFGGGFAALPPRAGGGAAVLSLPGVWQCNAVGSAGAAAAAAAVAAAGVSLRGGQFTSNSARSSGGGLYTSTPCSVGIHGTRGGGVYIGTTAPVWIAESIFSSNSADQQGGALAVAPPESSAATAPSAAATGNSSGGGFADASGDAGLLGVGAVEVTSSNFTGNSVKSSGGAIYANRGGAFSLTSCGFADNVAAQAGGAVAMVPPPFPAAFQPSAAGAYAMNDDSSGTGGGNSAAASNAANGLSSSGASLTLYGCTLTANAAVGLDGGGIFAAAGVAAALVNSTFAGNIAARNGGGAALVLQLDVLDQGGTSNSPDSPSAASSLALARAAFYRSHSRVAGCRFVGNTASYSGGGLMWAAPGTLVVSDSAFSGNAATGGGGGLAAYPPDHQPGLMGLLLSRNLDPTLGCWPLVITNCRLPYGHDATAAATTGVSGYVPVVASPGSDNQQAASAATTGVAAGANDRTTADANSSAAGGNSSHMWLQDSYASAVWPACDPARTATPEADTTMGAASPTAYELFAARRVPEAFAILAAGAPHPEDVAVAPLLNDSQQFLTLPPAAFRIITLQRYDANTALTSGTSAAGGTKLHIQVQLINGLGIPVGSDDAWEIVAGLSLVTAAGTSSPDGLPLAILESRALELTVVASGWPGVYELVVSAVSVSSGYISVEVSPLREPVLLLPCAAGEQLDASRVTPGSPAWTSCSVCQPDQYDFWADTRPLTPSPAPSYGPATATDASGSSNGTTAAVYDGDGATLAAAGLGAIAPGAGASPAALYAWVRESAMPMAQCHNCPDRAICPGGAVVVPQPGYWHSAPNSTQMHRCPKPNACLATRGASVESTGAAAAAFLASLSTANASGVFAAATAAGFGGSGYFGLGTVSSGELRSQVLLLCQQQWYASRPPGAAALSRLVNAPPPTLPPTSAAQPQQQLQEPPPPLPCYLWGVPADHPGSYMQLQCAPGYTGQLCASCQRGYFLTSDLDCAKCLAVPATAALVTLGVLGNAALVLYSAWTNLKDGIGLHADVSAADVLKVAIVHMQYFVIICRLNIDWPNVIARFQGALGALTGAQGKFISAPSCLAPDAGPGEQAQMQLSAGLITPIVVIGIVVALWSIRYRLGKRALRGHQATILGAGPPSGRRRNATRRRRHRGSGGGSDDSDGGKGSGTPAGAKPPRGWMAKGASKGEAATGSASYRPGCARRLAFGENETPRSGSMAAYPAIGGATDGLIGSPPAQAARGPSFTFVGSSATGPQPGIYNDSVYDRAGDEPTKGGPASAVPSGTTGVHTVSSGTAQDDRLVSQGRQSQIGVSVIKPQQGSPQDGVLSSGTAFDSRSADVLDRSVRRGHSGTAGGSSVAAASAARLPTIADASDGGGLSAAACSFAPIASGDEPAPCAASGFPLDSPSATPTGTGPLPLPSPFAVSRGAAAAADAVRGLQIKVLTAAAGAAPHEQPRPRDPHTPKSPASGGAGSGPEAEEGAASTALASPRAAPNLLPPSHGGASASGFATDGGAGTVVSDSGPGRLRTFNGLQLRQLAHRLAGGAAGVSSGSRRRGAGPASGGGMDTHELLGGHPAAAAAATGIAPGVGVGAASGPFATPFSLLISGSADVTSPSNTHYTDFTAEVLDRGPHGEQQSSATHSTSVRVGLLRSAAGASASAAANHSGSFGDARTPFGVVKASVLTEDVSTAGELTQGKSAVVPSSSLTVVGTGMPEAGAAARHRKLRQAFAIATRRLRSRCRGVAAAARKHARQHWTERDGEDSPSAADCADCAGATHAMFAMAAGVDAAAGAAGATETAAGVSTGAGNGAGDGAEEGHVHLHGRDSSGVARQTSGSSDDPTADAQYMVIVPAEHVDVMLGLGAQLRMVVMVALFVLYAGWSQVALSVFACRVIDDGQGQYGELQRATWRQGYWMRDINQKCYTGVHGSLYLPVGIAAVLAVCVAPPLASFVMLWRVRHRLNEPATQHLYGFLYLRYKPRYYYYECIVQLQTLCLVAVDVFGRGLPVLQQALLLLVVFNLIAAINMTAAPVRFRLLLVLEFVSLGVLSTTVTLGLFFVDGGGGTTTGDGQQLMLSPQHHPPHIGSLRNHIPHQRAAAGRYPAVGSDAFADASPTAWGMPYGVEPIQGVSMYDSHPPGGSDTYDKGSPPSALASSSGGGGGTIGGAGATAFALSPHGGPKAPASAFQAGGGPPHVAVAAAVLPAANPAAAQAPGCQSPPAASLPEEPPSAVAPATHQAPPPLVSAFAASLGRGGRKAATTTPSRLGLRAQPQVPVQPQAGVDAGAQGVAGAEPLRFRPAALQLPGSARAEKAGDSDPEFFSPARSSVALFGTPGCSTPHGSPGPVSPTAHQPPWVGSSHASPAPSPAAHQSQGCAAAAHATAGGAAGFNGVQQPSRFARMNSARDAASSSPGGFAQPTAAAATAPGYRNAEQQSQLLNGRGSSGGGGLLKSLGSWRSGIGAGLQEGSPSRGGQPPRRQPQPGPQEQSHHDYDFSDLLDNQD
eukprot:XP_001692335.1 predicted protein [Chlamydomonas reinhardtii]